MVRLLLALGLLAIGAQQEIDPALRTAVDRYLTAQVTEDVDGYMALWSKTAKRPSLDQLKYVFASGDDKFMDLEITRAVVTADTARVRGAVTRIRTAINATNPDGSPRMFTTRLQFALAYVREDGEWKLVREGSPADDLAAALVATEDASARGALLQADADLVNTRLVDALGRQADALARNSQFERALAIYDRGIEVAVAMKDRRAEGQMLQNRANSLYFLGDFAGALSAYEQRLAIERELKNDEGIASALVGIATIRYARHEYSTALKQYLEAFEIQERLGDEALAATTLVSTANVRYLQGDFDAAIADYRRAEVLKRKYHDLAGAAMALEGLGRTYAAQGDFASAFVAFAALLDEATRRRDVRRQASAFHNIGDVHTKLANLDAARVAYDESRKVYEAGKDLANAGRALHGTAIVELMAGRMPEAEQAYEKSRAACAAAKPEASDCVARALVGLGYALAAQERWDAAIVSYRKGIESFQALKATEAAARAQVGLAEALSGKEEYVAAMAEATSARHVAVTLGTDDLLWRALVSQSRAQRKLTRAQDAFKSAKDAVLAVRRMADASLLRPGHAIARDTSAAYAHLAIVQVEAGDAAGAWETVEEMRAKALRNALAPNEREISRGMTDEERETERALAAELTALHVQRDRENAQANPDAERLKRLDAAIGPATEKRNAWQRILFARIPDLSTWRGLSAPAAIADFAAALPIDRQLAVQFVVGEQELLVLTALRTGQAVELGAKVVPIKLRALAEKVARVVDPAALGDVVAWRKAAPEFMTLLPADVIDQMVAANSVVVIPDDMLWRIPFEALPVGGAYLGDATRVIYAASMTSLVRAPARTGEAPAFRVAVLAAPEVAPPVVEGLKSTAPTWTLRAADAALAHAARIESAAGKEQVTLISGAGATEDAFRSAASIASVLHVEGPFRVNAASPLFSSILLAPTPQAGAAGAPVPPAQDGVLEAREIPSANLSSRVVLFADPAALSMRDSAAAVPALHWVWRAGGIDALVVRRWGSDESIAGDLLAAFYDALRDGATPASAQRAAVDAVRKARPDLPPGAWAGWLSISAR